ncbi:MAG: DUF2079 domain-containing protein [Acidimicrobiales bacterium]
MAYDTTVATRPDPAVHARPPTDGDPGRPDRRWTWLRVAGAVVMALWCIGLFVYSTAIYHHNNLGEDFATYNQAWTLIGQGHLNPYDTIYHYSFIKGDFELIIWPLALVHLVYPGSVALLWIQDLAVAGSGFVVYLWIVDYLERRTVQWWPAVGVASVVLAVLVASPGAYQILSFDFHMEPISTVFVLLAGRDLWSGRHRRAWIWVAVALACGTFAAITLVGLGISALLAGRETRRQGALVIAAAVGWLAVVSLLGASAGSGITTYAHLVGRQTLAGPTGIVVLVSGLLLHPARIIDQVHDRLSSMYVLIKQTGVVGLASAWGFGVPAVVMVVNALSDNSALSNQAFQNAAVYPFVLLGTVMVLVWTAQRFRYGWIPALAVAVAVTVQALSYGAGSAPATVRSSISEIGSARATQINRALALTPPDAEVISTISVMGRFCSRPDCYWFYPNGSFPVQSRPVVFVFDPASENKFPGADAVVDVSAVAFIRDHLHARTLVDADGVTALVWRPPAGTTEVHVATRS